MEFIKDFKNLSKYDAAIAGGKGASLGEISQAGLPVPPRFVILSNAFEKFLEETLKKVERFIIIIEGEIEIGIDSKVYCLKKESNCEQGDSLYSTSSARHKIKNIGDSVARALCVNSPPVL